MAEAEKNQYKIVANELNSKGQQIIKHRPEVDLHADSDDFYRMQDYVRAMFELISDRNGKNNVIYYVCVCVVGFCVN